MSNYPRTNNRYSSIGDKTAGVVNAQGGSILSVTCANTAAEDRYLMFFDKATLANGTDKPILSVPVYKNNGYTELGEPLLGKAGLISDNGISWAFSTNGLVYTPGAITDAILYLLWV